MWWKLALAGIGGYLVYSYLSKAQKIDAIKKGLEDPLYQFDSNYLSVVEAGGKWQVRQTIKGSTVVVAYGSTLDKLYDLIVNKKMPASVSTYKANLSTQPAYDADLVVAGAYVAPTVATTTAPAATAPAATAGWYSF